MKVAVWLLALFFFAVAVTLGARYNSGYVLVVSPPYRIELSLNLLVAVLLALLFVAYFAVRLVVVTSRLPAEVSDFRARQRREKAHAAMMDGLRAFFEGRYAKAERACAAALEMEQPPEMAAINATIAARSAHELRRYSQRDEFIDKAESSAPDEVTLRLMTHAELLLDEHRPDEALKLLDALRTTGTRQHTAALRLELKARQLSRDWVAVLDLLRQLERRNALDMNLIRQWRRHAHLEGFKSRTQDPQALKEYWQNISPLDKKDSKLAAAAAHAYATLSDCGAAHQIIEQSLDDRWDSELAELYGECVENDAIRQIERAEAWLKSHPNDAALLLALGKLCTHCELWGKAQNYLEASLSVEPSYTAHLALARLYEKVGRPEPAKDHYDKGLELALRRLELD
ncbi:heme biosynthesis HemY N-terminal domain-containing protein [Nitrosospira sp. Is2]|uniref:heme biosynthesis HemY N-terminal domain-containing protein n=1 Tax=Nitrosospira sp. Is2 TaxID=3080532 RepID=UPI002955DB6D|nr:heme biosynthesis HemY N-terminal domain-containing protein [Nitrosospira sp. Is2]WON75196.1 heme biosynthesis HemY N-terminal domain-containing protein [Nitrosospira sp. Is2]